MTNPVMRRLLAVALMLGVRTPALAQGGPTRHPIELGIDAAVWHESSDGGDGTGAVLPTPRLRAGFVLSDRWSLEPGVYVAYDRSSFTNPVTNETLHGSSLTYDLDVGLVVRFRPADSHARPYVRPFAGIRGFSSHIDAGEFDNSGSQLTLGGGLGVAIRAGDRVATRIEGAYRRAFEDEPDLPRSNRLSLSAGLSFFIG